MLARLTLVLVVVLALAGCGSTLMTVGGTMSCGLMPMAADQCLPAPPEATDPGAKENP